MKRPHQLFASILIFLLSPMSANATLISGSFSVNFDTTSVFYQGIPTLSGNWTADIDSSNIPALGNYSFDNHALTSFTLNPNPLRPFGTVFDVTNVSVDIHFTNSMLNFWLIGGNIGGNQAIIGNPDDFLILKRQINPQNSQARVTVSTKSGQSIVGGPIADYSVTAVPEPSTLALLAIGFGCMYCRRAGVGRA